MLKIISKTNSLFAIEWYPGDPPPAVSFPIHKVVSNGSTTEFILRTFSGLPFRGQARYADGSDSDNFADRQVWSGDFAQFIVDNL